MKFSATTLKDLSKEYILLSLTHDDGIPEAILARGIVDDLISDDSDFVLSACLVHMVDSQFWYDSTQTDATKRKRSSLQFFVLGCLHVLGTLASQIVVQTNNPNIDQEVHRHFFLLWLQHSMHPWDSKE
jgi:hypothetical protein